MKKQSLIRLCIVAVPAVIALASLRSNEPAAGGPIAQPSAVEAEHETKPRRVVRFGDPARDHAHGHASEHGHHPHDSHDHGHPHHGSELSEERVDKFVAMLDADDDFVRAQGVYGLANASVVTPELGEKILTMIADTDDVALQKVGVWAVSRSGMPNAAGKLAHLAVELPNPEVGRRVVENLAAMRSGNAHRAMASVMADSTSPAVRAKAAMVLGSSGRGSEAALDALIDTAIHDVDPSVRSAALRAMGSSSSPARRAALRKLSQTASSASVRAQAAQQLERAEMRLGDRTEVARRFASTNKSSAQPDNAQLSHHH